MAYIAPPDPRHFRDGYPEVFFLRELAGQRQGASALLALAGERGGGLPVTPEEGLGREVVLDVLALHACLSSYRLLIPGPWPKPYYKGAVVLLGANLSFFGQAIEGEVEGGPIPPGQPLLCDPRDGRILALAPYLRWEPGRTPAEGTLFILTALEGHMGIYDEVGAASARRLVLPLHGSPAALRYPLLPGQRLAVHHPPGRYQDGERLEPHYLVHGLMWRGGVADIYRSRQLDTGLPVVLKTFEGEADGENRARFQDELAFGGRVSHPSVVRARPARQLSGPLVMELDYAAGGNLSDRLALAGVLAPDETLAIMGALCEALEAVHSAGIIHLDLKPDNILFSAGGELRLIDFGIAASVDRQRRQLRPGYLVGTPGYIPPERRRGELLTTAADLWALGVLASRMLTGALPDVPEDLPPPPRLHPALAAVLGRLLAPEPEDRYRSARAALDAFRAAVSMVSPVRAIAIDLEGTILTTAYRPVPRPKLDDFARFCLAEFQRIFIYTAVEPQLAWAILRGFAAERTLPTAFLERAEMVDWPRGEGGSLKDLRRLGLPLSWVLLLDDMASWVVPDQLHRWVRISAYDEPRPGDRELQFVRPRILAQLAAP
jgi:serine/threonine-protein kinase